MLQLSAIRVWMICVCCFINGCVGKISKRLLLSDPEVLSSRLSNLEQSLEQLRQEKVQQDAKIKQQEILINQQGVTISQQVTKLTQQDAKIKSLDATVTSLRNLPRSSGSTYTIWGKATCPTGNDTQMLYTGYAAGGLVSEKGGSPDNVCLAVNAEFEKTTPLDYSRIYGAEYDSDFYKHQSNGEDVPCSVCYRKSTSSSIMIPGRKTCLQGWQREYYGYLSSEYHAHEDGSNYICMDVNPDFLAGGAENTNLGRLFVPVTVKCGTLRCPPYHDNYAVTCVVCSK